MALGTRAGLRAMRQLTAGLLLIASSSVEAADESPLDPYRFRRGLHAGSLRAEVPLPLYHEDPGHLWNRLFAAFYIRPLPVPSSSFESDPSRAGAETSIPPELSPELRSRWRATYSRRADVRIEGGDVLDPPLLPRPEALLSGERFAAAEAVVDEFLNAGGEALIEDPLRRALLQRDLWSIYDYLGGDWYDPGAGNWLEVDEETKERKRRLREKTAAVMEAIAPSRGDLEKLPNTYALAVRSGRFVRAHGGKRGVAYLPPDLFGPAGDWVEITHERSRWQTPPQIFIHSGHHGLEGREWFRVFFRFPESAGGRKALVEFLEKNRESGRFSPPDVPPGTEAAIVRVLLAIDSRGEIVPTPVIEEVEIRVRMHVDGKPHPETDSGFGENFYKHVFSRLDLFRGSAGGGLRHVPGDMPARFFRVFPFSTYGSTSRPGILTTLHETCTSCHGNVHGDTTLGIVSLDFVRAGRSDERVAAAFPDFPFGRDSFFSLAPGFRATAVLPGGAGHLAGRLIEYKASRDDFRSLMEHWRGAPSREKD